MVKLLPISRGLIDRMTSANYVTIMDGDTVVWQGMEDQSEPDPLPWTNPVTGQIQNWRPNTAIATDGH